MLSQLRANGLLTQPNPTAKICLFSEGPRRETNFLLPFAELKILTVTHQTDVGTILKLKNYCYNLSHSDKVFH